MSIANGSASPQSSVPRSATLEKVISRLVAPPWKAVGCLYINMPLGTDHYFFGGGGDEKS